MPNRHLRERGTAAAQRLDRIDARMRVLMAKAWAGALRTARAQRSTPLTYSTYVPAVSVIVPSGRWFVHAEATFLVTAAVGDEDFYLNVDLLDPTTGMASAITTSDIAARRCAPAATAGAPLAVPLVLLEDFSSQGDVTVSLSTRNLAGNAYTVDAPRLLVLPV